MKNRAIFIRADEKEHEIVTRESKSLGLSMSAFIRLLIRQWDNGVQFGKREETEQSTRRSKNNN